MLLLPLLRRPGRRWSTCWRRTPTSRGEEEEREVFFGRVFGLSSLLFSSLLSLSLTLLFSSSLSLPFLVKKNRRFPPPPRRDAAIIVGAEADAYVSKSAVEELARHWGAAAGGEEAEEELKGERQRQRQRPRPPTAGGGGGAAEVRWVPGGHVSAFLSQGEAFRGALRDAMERLALPAPAKAAGEREEET